MLNAFETGTPRVLAFGPDDAATQDLRSSAGWATARSYYESVVARNGGVLKQAVIPVSGVMSISEGLSHPVAAVVGSWSAWISPLDSHTIAVLGNNPMSVSSAANGLINTSTTSVKLANFRVPLWIPMPFADNHQYFYWTEPSP